MPSPALRRLRALAAGSLIAALALGGVAFGTSPASADEAGTISGVLTGAEPDARAISGASVTAYPDGSTFAASRTSTAADGSFTLSGLQPGAYRVATRQQSPSHWMDSPLAAGFWGATLEELATAPVVHVAAGQVVMDDIELAHYASISGTVVNDADGSPVPGAMVSAVPVADGDAPSAVASADGTFTIWMYRGTFQLNAIAINGLVFSSASPGPITVDVSDVATGAEIRMTRGGTVSGTATFSTGGPAAGVAVSVVDPASGSTVNIANTDAAGHFTVDSLATGTYAVGFGQFADFPSSFHPIWYGGVEDLASATTVDVATGQDIDGIDAVLVPSTEQMTPGVVRIVGNPTVGENLSVDSGTWIPTLTSSITQWLRDGEPIPGAAWSFYTVTDEDLGHSLTVQVTGYSAGYVPTPAVSAPTTVVGKRMITATPTISGTVKVGRTLTARPGDWTPNGVTYGYQWLRWGQEIAGATAKTYTVGLDDQGTSLSVRVTGRKADWGDTPATSAWTVNVASLPSVTAGTVTIAGRARVGSTLTAQTSSWSPGGSTYAYQWLRSGTPIDGATAKTYTAVATDAGAPLSVRVTASKAHYTSASSTSDPTASVALR